MRTIKFRGKRCDNGEWVYGYYARLRNEFKEWHCIMTEEDASENYIKDCNGYNMLYTPVNHNTIGQFTGLYDKNGKEIYEGDIISSKENPQIKHLIFYNEKQAKFMAGFYGNTSIYAFGVCGVDNPAWMAEKEVIGNIHDNKKLLEQ